MQAKQLLKIIISLFLHTSLQSPPPPLFLAFLWTKFICTETAQRFPFFKKEEEEKKNHPLFFFFFKGKSIQYPPPIILFTNWQLHIRSDRSLLKSLPCLLIILLSATSESSKDGSYPTNSYQKREILSTPILISIGLFISPLSLSVQYLQ